jgi:hypothetical protein
MIVEISQHGPALDSQTLSIGCRVGPLYSARTAVMDKLAIPTPTPRQRTRVTNPRILPTAGVGFGEETYRIRVNLLGF